MAGALMCVPQTLRNRCDSGSVCCSVLRREERFNRGGDFSDFR
jgi:hypothetical protein